MSDDNNIYQAPESDLAFQAEDGNIENIAKAQKIIIYAIVLYFLGFSVGLYIEFAGGLMVLGGMLLGMFGIIKLAINMGESILVKILYIILMLIPLISLITLVVLNSRATTRLRDNGYKVGLLGASKVGVSEK